MSSLELFGGWIVSLAPPSSFLPRPKSAEWEPGFTVLVGLGLDSVSEEAVLLVTLVVLVGFEASLDATAACISEGFEGSGLLILLAGVVFEGKESVALVVLAIPPVI